MDKFQLARQEAALARQHLETLLIRLENCESESYDRAYDAISKQPRETVESALALLRNDDFLKT